MPLLPPEPHRNMTTLGRYVFSDVFTPGKDLAVDETMIKFQGRASMKQYMPKKPTKRRIKVWVIMDIFVGYRCTLKKGNSTENNLGSRVVKDLTFDFRNKWHLVFFDNLFNSKNSVTWRQWACMDVGQQGRIGSTSPQI